MVNRYRLHPDPLRVVLTVSPVPLTATASDRHVLVANTYSKAVLRAVAEELYLESPYIDYVPSFELVTNPKLVASHYLANCALFQMQVLDGNELFSGTASRARSSSALKYADRILGFGLRGRTSHCLRKGSLILSTPQMNRRVLLIEHHTSGCCIELRILNTSSSLEVSPTAFGVPVWRLMLNQADLVVHSDALWFEPRGVSTLREFLIRLIPAFRVWLVVSAAFLITRIVTDLTGLAAVVFVDCLFRFPPDLVDGLKQDARQVVWYGDQPVTQDLLLELPNLAGGVTSFTEPFCSAGLPFQVERPTSFLNLFAVMRHAWPMSFFLWTFPGFREQFPTHPTGMTDLDLMERVHRYALQKVDVNIEYLRPPDCCLDLRTGRVRSEFLGDGFHASDAFGVLAWKELISAVMSRL